MRLRAPTPVLSAPLLVFTACYWGALNLREVHASSYADGGDDLACWKAKLMVSCSEVFPGVDVKVDWTALSEKLVEGSEISIPSHIVIPDSLNVTTADFKEHGFEIDHTNLHACKVSGGFCSPFVAQQPGLVTHSAALKGASGASNGVDFEFVLEPGDWTYITHYRIFVDDNVRCDFAKGKIVHVDPLLTETVASPAVVSISIALSVVGMVISLVFLVCSFAFREKNIFKLASWKFCALASLGGIIGNACILLWTPPLTPALCVLRPFLIPLAFDFVFFPLLLKTWRLKVLLVDSKMKKLNVTDMLLLKGILAPVVVDIIIGIAWVLTDPPSPDKIMSQISESRYETFCISSSPAWMIVVILLKVPFVLWGLMLAWATRAIISVMNESSHVMLSMINLFFVGAYVIVIQFLITDSQTALVMLRALGTFIATTLTLTIVLGPKVLRLARYGDIEGLASAVRRETERRISQISQHGRRESEAESRSAIEMGSAEDTNSNKYVAEEGTPPAV